MKLCENCVKQCHTEQDPSGIGTCVECERVLEQYLYTEEPSFLKGAGGESRFSWNYCRASHSHYSESFRRTLPTGNDEINHQMVQLTIGNGNNSLERQNAVGAIKQMPVKKGFSSKINLKELEKLFDESDDNPSSSFER